MKRVVAIAVTAVLIVLCVVTFAVAQAEGEYEALRSVERKAQQLLDQREAAGRRFTPIMQELDQALEVVREARRDG